MSSIPESFCNGEPARFLSACEDFSTAVLTLVLTTFRTRVDPPSPRGVRGLTPSASSAISIRRAPVAQLDRASDYGSEGLKFESSRVRHVTQASPTGAGE